MKKVFFIILIIAIFFVGFFIGFYVGKYHLDEKLVAEKAKAVREMFEAQGPITKSVEAQIRLVEIGYKQEASESRRAWIDIGIFIILAASLIQPWIIRFLERRWKTFQI